MSATTQTAVPITAPDARHLNGRVADFLMLGGGSLLALLGLRWAFGDATWAGAWSAGTTLALANVINNPHFAHSYQLFYRDFGAKLTRYPPALRLRYWLCGIAVPMALAAFMGATIVMGQPRALGLLTNLMFFLVGWHYVKQGYGLAMVDAALKRAFFTEAEKAALLRNAYAVWLLSWLLLNRMLGGVASHYWGVEYVFISIPAPLVWLATVAAVACGSELVWRLLRRWRRGDAIAWNGLVAYAASGYAWLMIRDPILVLWVPLFHSLQYLAVVWRYEANRNRALRPHDMLPELRLAGFYAVALGLGYLGFWWLPRYLNTHVPYDHALFGTGLFFFVFWIFINLHHYFLDTVMWRKGNPDVQRHLFAHVSPHGGRSSPPA
ncbi:MAG TPA: hypothetical protein VHF86_03325 [Xanthomonadaceae bacterium]|nr:hypothetical protein [Xanthomonadaceae bacterium]